MNHIPPELVHAIIDDVISWNSKFYRFKLRMVNKFFCSLVSPKVENMLSTGNEVRRTGSANLSREPPSDMVEMV